MPKLTIFKNPKSPDDVLDTVELDDLLSDIKFGKWKVEVEKARGDKQYKLELPQALWSGIFTYRSEEKLASHSGFICIDIDQDIDEQKRQTLCDDPYTRALFTTSGGGGVAVIVKIKPSDHRGSFRWLQKYYFESYGIIIDPAKASPASGQNVSYDPGLFKRDSSKQAGTLREPKARKNRTLPVVLPDDKIGELVGEISRRGTDLAPDYQSYVELGFAIANGLGENGRNYYHQLCQVSEKYNERHCDKQYDYSLKGRREGITIGTFFFMAKEAGFDLPKDEQYQEVARSFEIAKRSGRSKKEALETLTKVDGVDPDLAESVASSVFSRSDLKSDKKTEFFKMYRHYLTGEFDLQYNVIKMRPEIDSFPMDDSKLNDIYTDAMEIFGADVKKTHTKDLIDKLSRQNCYDPFQKFYDEYAHLRPAEDIIDRFISSIESNTEGYEKFVRKWMIGLAAAAIGRQPVRYILILTGGQFAGKTEFFRRLLPKELDEYYALMTREANILDERLNMCTHLLMCMDDMDGNTWREDRSIKYHSSATKFSQRLKYGIMPSELRRLAVFCGTSNDENILSDPTGNTRMIPIKVSGMNFELRDSIDRKELLIALFRAYEAGEEWQLTDEDFAVLNRVSESHRFIDEEGESIDRFFKKKEAPTEFEEKLTATEIMDYIARNSMVKLTNVRKIGVSLNKMFESSLYQGRRRYHVVKKKDNQSAMIWNDIPESDDVSKDLPF